MRLRAIRWKSYEAAIQRDRYDFHCWLHQQGALVVPWMLAWEVYW